MNRPAHYPKIPCEPGKWASQHKPEDVRIWDIFTLRSGQVVQITEIRDIKRHAIYEPIWEFVDRHTGKVIHFNEFDWIHNENL